jgi:hypothetical protein
VQGAEGVRPVVAREARGGLVGPLSSTAASARLI